jgi:hypothetical protein
MISAGHRLADLLGGRRVGTGRVGGWEEERGPLCVPCLVLLQADAAALWQRLRGHTGCPMESEARKGRGGSVVPAFR